ncbi:hypothetical protein AXG93_4660s1000 [Marchantia polymorpha subsp. ruderalis]|uniref:Uncharacterized protein n=1 Tax=Marchantia polymorpha subsp. ruderalis TaxID=1480154 RepID=A0A176WGV9_MARPO|nr:hypothetical protein AXG93_4660s1000 [Marchantia polymorpha subsp. ruderalis]
METPVRRMTRSQTGSGPSSAVKPPSSRTASSTKKKAVPRRALSDLTNDSPISGLMPSSMGSNLYESTPRSKLRPADCSRGEDVLRNQVTNLLKKVESTAAAKSPLLSDLQHDPEAFESPMRLAAPTPANTPATGSWPSAQEAVTVTLPERPCSSLRPTPSPIAIASPVCHLEVCLPLEKCNSYEAYVVSPFKIQDIESEQTSADENDYQDSTEEVQTTTRTLQFDSPERKAEILSTSDECTRTRLFDSPQRFPLESGEVSSPCSQMDEEDDCGWSVIVNVNSPETKLDAGAQEDYETLNFINNVIVDPEQQAENPAIWARRPSPRKEIDEEFDDCEDYEAYSEDEQEAALDQSAPQILDQACEELCRGISHISMGEVELNGVPEFQGKHVRFNYNSDDELEEEIVRDKKVDSPSKMKLKGCPTPKGKHLRFSDEQDE